MKKKDERESPLLDGLNAEQLDAVTCTDGPILVIAGAGTGKTTVIARRIAYIIEKGLARPHEILALTFTDKAANEMEERVDQLLPYGSFDTQIATFHSFGERLLRENALEIGLPTDFKVLTQPQQVLFFQQNLFRFELHHYRPLSTPTKFIQALIGLFSRCKDECVSPQQYKEFAYAMANSEKSNKNTVILNPFGKQSDRMGDHEESPKVTAQPNRSRSFVTRVPMDIGTTQDDKGGKVEELPVSSLFGRGRRKEGDNIDVDPTEIEKQLELAQVYEQYENFKAASGVVDFGDLIVKSLDLLKEQSTILRHYQERFKYILVDEFQDTNFAQNELVKLLAKSHKNICVVGDDDQSIYKFRGAAISNILQFKDHYKDAKQVVLTTNYRSTQPILDGAYRLIQHNNPDRLETKHNIIKKLESHKGTAGFAIQPLYLPTVSEEIDAVVAEIERLTAPRITNHESRIKQKTEREPRTANLEPSFDNPLTYNDIAILVRANAHAEPVLQSLATKGIPYKFTGTSGLYDRPEIRMLISFLTVITNFYDNLQLYNLCITPYFNLPIDDLIKLMDFSSRKSKPLYWAIEHCAELSHVIEISDESKTAIATLKEDILKYAELTKSQDVGHVLYQFLTDKSILANLQDEQTAEAATQIANIAKFFDKIKEFSKLTNDPSTKAFIEYLQIIREAGDDPGTAAIDTDFDGVNVMTVHAAKGLEFKVVFIINAIADRFPSRDRSEPIPLPDALIQETLPEGDFHLQEERRLFYVAMTRAAELLYITWARDYGGKRLRKVSPFVVEALGSNNIPQEVLAPVTSKKLEQLGLFWGNTPSNGNGHVSPGNLGTRQPGNQLTFAIEDDRLLSLSQGQVDDYLSCPLKYKYASILRIPLTRHHLFVYGAAMHQAIQKFYEAKMQQKTLPLATLLEVFEHSWTDEGFLSETHEKERFNQGNLTLKKFHEREKDNPKIPMAIEKPFRVNLTDTIRLMGRFDRIDTDGNSVHIIDFKTTENMTEEKALRRAKDSKQLAIYSLMYYKIAGKLPSKVSLYFIEDGVAGSFIPTAKTIQQAEEYVHEAARGIKAAQFEAKPDFMACTYCPYSPICPYTAARG